MSLTENYSLVKKRISDAAKRANRSDKDVTLISVSKTKPVSDIEEIYRAGSRDFGENKVQELLEKSAVLPEDIRWHMIGHLQTNKVKSVVDKACLIHSVDSLKLAKEIQKQAQKKDISCDILIEVNIAEEESKFGLMKKDVFDVIKAVSGFDRINIKGLMTIAPYVEDPELNRPYFRALKELSVDISAQNIDNVSMNILSMGMTGDFEVAIEEGATHVRVGTGIFGQRDYSI